MGEPVRIYVFCEGQTEETFVKTILYSHFLSLGRYITPIIVATSGHSKGGLHSYAQLRGQVLRKCKEDPSAWVTTMVDLYALPKDFPCAAEKYPTPTQKAIAICGAFVQDIAQRNFVANIMVHEFETLLFSAPEYFDGWFDNSAAKKLEKILAEHGGQPESINDGPMTAPSKQILSVCSNYDKVLHGSLIANDIGLPQMRIKCPVFDRWLTTLEKLQ